MKPGVSEKTIWKSSPLRDAEDAVPRGLGFVGDDGHALAHQLIHRNYLAPEGCDI
jgi:hypothetical protein